MCRMDRFRGKIAVVVGGNSGIGLAAAKAFADEGARVVIAGRDPDTLDAALEVIGRSSIGHRCDVSDVKQIARLFSAIAAEVGRIDVLFVNAGVALALPLESVTEENWDWVQDINVRGCFFSIQKALPLLSRGSAVVLTGSVAALLGQPNESVYAASKAALRSLGLSFAAELVDRGIRVNVVSPGPIQTPMLHRIVGLPSESVPSLREEMIRYTPMKRLGTPEEVAAAVLFLASDAAAFVTGVDFLVDGGVAGL